MEKARNPEISLEVFRQPGSMNWACRRPLLRPFVVGGSKPAAMFSSVVLPLTAMAWRIAQNWLFRDF